MRRRGQPEPAADVHVVLDVALGVEAELDVGRGADGATLDGQEVDRDRQLARVDPGDLRPDLGVAGQPFVLLRLPLRPCGEAGPGVGERRAGDMDGGPFDECGSLRIGDIRAGIGLLQAVQGENGRRWRSVVIALQRDQRRSTRPYDSDARRSLQRL